jgi:hypothetical protein
MSLNFGGVASDGGEGLGGAAVVEAGVLGWSLSQRDALVGQKCERTDDCLHGPTSRQECVICRFSDDKKRVLTLVWFFRSI